MPSPVYGETPRLSITLSTMSMRAAGTAAAAPGFAAMLKPLPAFLMRL
jgi:hypothetical protein